MALGEMRKRLRRAALTTASEMIRSMGEEGSDHEEQGMTEEEFEIFLEECKKVAQRLDKMANKL